MEEVKDVSSKGIALKWGLIFACLAALSVMVPAIGILVFFGFIAIIVMAHKAFKESNNGYMNFGKGISIASLIILIGSIFQSVAIYFYYKNNPSLFKAIKEKQLMFFEQMYSEEQLEQMTGMMDSLLNPTFVSISAFFGNFIIFFIIALVVTAFTKKNDPELI